MLPYFVARAPSVVQADSTKNSMDRVRGCLNLFILVLAPNVTDDIAFDNMLEIVNGQPCMYFTSQIINPVA